MYEPFFGMDRRPFSATPDPGCFFGSVELQAVLEELTVCVERGQGIAILTAAAGVGKTLLCQRLAANLRERESSRSQFECVYLSNSNFPTRRSLLQAILFEMGDEYSRRDEPELRLDLRSRLLSLRPEREALVLIVDEAHLFSDELLEELRTLSDLAAGGSSLVRIVLSGQHDLEERLTDRSFDAINQRISKHVFVEPLTISESADYIRHRLTWAGCNVESTLTEEAISIITRASGGVPRCLNQLSDHSLLLAFASDQKPVTADTVREALEDLKQLPLHWNDVSDGTEIVGFVEDENSSETFDDESEESVIDESVIDAERDAALARLAGNGSVDNRDNENPGPESADDNAVDEAGIVESLQAAFEVSPPVDQSANATTLADGFEFDFSDSFDNSGNESVDSDTDTAVEEQHFVADSQADSLTGKLPVDDDETLFQQLPSATNETILESEPLHDPASPQHADVDGEDTGISFRLTSNGFELNDFGPPEELDARIPEASPTDEQPVDSGVIEFSFNGETESTDVEDSCSSEPNADDGDFVSESEVSNADGYIAADDPESIGRDTVSEPSTVSAAEITLALFGQDSVLPEHRADTVMSSPADSESVDLNGAALPDREHTVDAVEAVSSEQDFAAEADKIERTSPQNEEPEVMNELAINESGYEEEFVYDPYAALQEPDGAGIVWNVSSFSRQVITEEHSELPEDTEVSAEVTADDPVDNDFEFDEELILDHGDTSEQECETAPASQHFIEEDFAEDFGIESAEDATGPAEEFDSHRQESETQDDHSDAVTKVPGNEVAGETVTASESSDDVDQSELVNDESDQSESHAADDRLAAELVERSIAEEAYEEQIRAQAEHDIVLPVEDRPLQPNHLVDAVLPLLAELDEDLDSIVRPGMAGRSVLDIEAELIETTDQNSNELEDLIGKTMLDICLDTQSALQDSAAAIRNAEAAELKNFNDATDELPAESFDIVQPEPPRRDESSSYKLEPRSADTSGKALSDGATSASPSPDEHAEKPFGRLFSDLRRRKG